MAELWHQSPKLQRALVITCSPPDGQACGPKPGLFSKAGWEEELPGSRPALPHSTKGFCCQTWDGWSSRVRNGQSYKKEKTTLWLLSSWWRSSQILFFVAFVSFMQPIVSLKTSGLTSQVMCFNELIRNFWLLLSFLCLWQQPCWYAGANTHTQRSPASRSGENTAANREGAGFPTPTWHPGACGSSPGGKHAPMSHQTGRVTLLRQSRRPLRSAVTQVLKLKLCLNPCSTSPGPVATLKATLYLFT